MEITKFKGYICDKTNTIIGEYSYSFSNCCFSFTIHGQIHHFWKKEELEEYLLAGGYHILED